MNKILSRTEISSKGVLKFLQNDVDYSYLEENNPELLKKINTFKSELSENISFFDSSVNNTIIEKEETDQNIDDPQTENIHKKRKKRRRTEE